MENSVPDLIKNGIANLLGNPYDETIFHFSFPDEINKHIEKVCSTFFLTDQQARISGNGSIAEDNEIDKGIEMSSSFSDYPLKIRLIVLGHLTNMNFPLELIKEKALELWDEIETATREEYFQYLSFLYSLGLSDEAHKHLKYLMSNAGNVKEQLYYAPFLILDECCDESVRFVKGIDCKELKGDDSLFAYVQICLHNWLLQEAGTAIPLIGDKELRAFFSANMSLRESDIQTAIKIHQNLLSSTDNNTIRFKSTKELAFIYRSINRIEDAVEILEKTLESTNHLWPQVQRHIFSFELAQCMRTEKNYAEAKKIIKEDLSSCLFPYAKDLLKLLFSLIEFEHEGQLVSCDALNKQHYLPTLLTYYQPWQCLAKAKLQKLRGLENESYLTVLNLSSNSFLEPEKRKALKASLQNTGKWNTKESASLIASAFLPFIKEDEIEQTWIYKEALI